MAEEFEEVDEESAGVLEAGGGFSSHCPLSASDRIGRRKNKEKPTRRKKTLTPTRTFCVSVMGYAA